MDMRRTGPALLLAIALASGGVIRSNAAAETSDSSLALHVLNRITFGPRPGDLSRVQQLGVDRYIDQQLHPERIDDSEMSRHLDGFQTLRLSSSEIAERYEIPALQERRQRQQAAGKQGNDQQVAGSQPADMPRPQDAAMDPERQRANLPLVELSQQKIVRAVYSDRQLQEVLTDFWFNHFNVDARKGPARYMLTEYERDAIRPHVLGHFRDLLGATAKSPAMLFYLDNWMSADPNGPHLDRARPAMRRFGAAGGGQARARRPLPQAPSAGNQQTQKRPMGLNENYGRELLELHTLGVDGGYTQKDVTEVARAFTGWTIENPRRGGSFRFAPALHDDGEKMVLGHRIKAGGGEHDGEEVLDIVASHPATARFISTKLARRFVSDNPPDALVDRMASTFTKSNGDLRAVMTVLLESKEFRAPDVERVKIKNPFEFIVSSLRATGATIDDARPLVRSMQQLGMPLYQCQPPTGYKDSADTWVNTGALVNRMNVALTLTSGRTPGVIVPVAAEPIALVGEVSDTTRATIAKAQTPPQAMALALGSPEFQRR
jgi:uncharacterized protein (DUF1800 family)